MAAECVGVHGALTAGGSAADKLQDSAELSMQSTGSGRLLLSRRLLWEAEMPIMLIIPNAVMNAFEGWLILRYSAYVVIAALLSQDSISRPLPSPRTLVAINQLLILLKIPTSFWLSEGG